MRKRSVVIIGLSVSLVSFGYIIGLSIGSTIAKPEPVTITKTVTVPVAPDSCRAAIIQDNEWFGLIADSIGDSQWDRLTNNMSRTTSARNSNVNDCLSHVNQGREN